MLPFKVALRSGESPYRQVVYAATRAILSGELPQGEAFPSVRELSQTLKINPNTAQKIIGELVRAGLLEVQPGIGTIVAAGRRSSAAERWALLSRDVEQLIVEARRLGLEADDVIEAIEEQWARLFGERAAVRTR